MNNKAKVSPTVTEQFNATSVTKGYTYCREIKCTVNNTTVQYNIYLAFPQSHTVQEAINNRLLSQQILTPHLCTNNSNFPIKIICSKI